MAQIKLGCLHNLSFHWRRFPAAWIPTTLHGLSSIYPLFSFHLFSSPFLFSLRTPPPCASSPFIPFVLSVTLAHYVFRYFPKGAKQNVCDIFQIYCCIFLLSLKKYRKLLHNKSYWSKQSWHYFVNTRYCCCCCCCCFCFWGGGGGAVVVNKGVLD